MSLITVSIVGDTIINNAIVITKVMF